jgi:RNase P subunit RPR2
MQEIATKAVTCPHCGESTRITRPDEGAEVKVRESVAAFGDHTTVTCSNGHTYWVYFC